MSVLIGLFLLLLAARWVNRSLAEQYKECKARFQRSPWETILSIFTPGEQATRACVKTVYSNAESSTRAVHTHVLVGQPWPRTAAVKKKECERERKKKKRNTQAELGVEPPGPDWKFPK